MIVSIADERSSMSMLPTIELSFSDKITFFVEEPSVFHAVFARTQLPLLDAAEQHLHAP
jgi:hypothetical protein